MQLAILILICLGAFPSSWAIGSGQAHSLFSFQDQNLNGYRIGTLNNSPTCPDGNRYRSDLICQTGGKVREWSDYDSHSGTRQGTRYDDDAYGMLLATSGSIQNFYRYTGEQWDPDLGMYYLRARYFQPDIGRFWTMDTYEGSQSDPISLHKYLYCAADPVNNTAPSGNMTLAAQVPTFGTMFTLAGLSLPSLASAKATAVTLTLAIAAEASLSGSTEAAQEQAAIQAAEMTLAGAGTSMANELARAEQIWRTRNGNSRRPKFVPVSRKIMPDVANHVAIAQLVHGPFLNRAQPGQGAKNRYQVLKGSRTRHELG